MSFNIIFSFVTLILIFFALILKGQALEKLFYIFVLDLVLLIVVTRGFPSALLFVGTIIPLFTGDIVPASKLIQKKASRQDVKYKIISYIAFAPLIGLGIMSYRIPLIEIKYLPPVLIILGGVSLFVITFVMMMPKRIKFK